MSSEAWGLLGSGQLSEPRRVRTLGLGPAVREFNELAVPGMAGVWFGKQVLLSVLGILVAEEARRRGVRASNIETANAIEALACMLALRRNDWAPDRRLKGRNKLLGKRDDDLVFSRLRQRNFYVTQPMRMQTVRALPELGFVERGSIRFNAFQPTAAAHEFVRSACDGFRRDLPGLLAEWVAQGKHGRVDTPRLHDVLSPVTPMAPAGAAMLLDRIKGEARRRRVLDWVESLAEPGISRPDWKRAPAGFDDDGHWFDLRCGAALFLVRDEAVGLLDEVEAKVAQSARQALRLGPEALDADLTERLQRLRAAAARFLELGHGNTEANTFCRECASAGDADVLRNLVNRDGHILRLQGRDCIVPGAAFGRRAAGSDEETESGAPGIPLPIGISDRIRRLFLLNRDLRHRDLGDWIGREPSE